MQPRTHTCVPPDADYSAACCRPRHPGMNRGETTELDPVGPPVLAPIPTSERVYNPSIVAPASPAIVAANRLLLRSTHPRPLPGRSRPSGQGACRSIVRASSGGRLCAVAQHASEKR